MKNPFKKNGMPDAKPSRSAFDLSFSNNLTMKFGELVPVFCKEVVPGDNFRIKPTFGFNLMPTVFPVQTRMKASLSFFYVRARTLWKDFPDFYFNTKQGLTHPYLKILESNKDFFKTGSLADYLDVPTTNADQFTSSMPVETSNAFGDVLDARAFSNASDYTSVGAVNHPIDPARDYLFEHKGYFLPNATVERVVGGQDAVGTFVESFSQEDVSKFSRCTLVQSHFEDNFVLRDDHYIGTFPEAYVPSNFIDTKFNPDDYNALSGFKLFIAYGYGLQSCMIVQSVDVTLSCVFKKVVNAGTSSAPTSLWTMSVDLYDDSNDLAHATIDAIHQTHPGAFVHMFLVNTSWNAPSAIVSGKTVSLKENSEVYPEMIFSSTSPASTQYFGSLGCKFYYTPDSVVISDADTQSPFVDYGSGPAVPLSVLPFRAYEAVYNAFYRDQRNDPFVVNGEVEYNKFIPTDEGGADSYPYALHKKKWEDDFLTSAVPSPQQGIAPLVGVSYSPNSGVATFQFKDENEDTYTAQVSIDDSHKLTGIDIASPDMPQGSLRALQDVINHGISINDFRNVNCLQRWLERNIRSGYRYRDLIKSHFGQELSYNDLQMPEFLGGHSQMVSMNKIIQTSPTEGSPTGTFSGQGTIFGQCDKWITKQCDEPGFIIGIMSITPTPNYSQLLPKHFLKVNTLDYYQPEFDKIGMQPIDYREVCPIGAYRLGLTTGEDELNKTFGYQRPWYDYIRSVDTIHGQMRTTLNNYVMNRTFTDLPVLNESFILVDQNQLNDVFAYQKDDYDKIIGQIYFEVEALRPFSRFNIPSIE